MGKTREDGVRNGQAAWNALKKKYNSNTKEARRVHHEYLHNAKMKSGDDPDDFLYVMDGYRERLKGMGQPVPDERYEDIILRPFLPSTRGSAQLATRDGIFTRQIFGA